MGQFEFDIPLSLRKKLLSIKDIYKPSRVKDFKHRPSQYPNFSTVLPHRCNITFILEYFLLALSIQAMKSLTMPRFQSLNPSISLIRSAAGFFPAGSALWQQPQWRPAVYTEECGCSPCNEDVSPESRVVQIAILSLNSNLFEMIWRYKLNQINLIWQHFGQIQIIWIISVAVQITLVPLKSNQITYSNRI